MPQTTCFVLDLDDTLYPERDYVRSGFQAIDSLAVARLGLEGFGDACWRSFVNGDRGRIFDQVLKQRYGVVDADLVGEMVGKYRAHRPRINLHQDAARFLEHIGSLGAPLALITDGPRESQRAKIQALELDSVFSPIVVTAELGEGKSKPHASAFELVQEALGRDRSFVYIADNPLKDFLAPNQLGWSSIRIQRTDGIYSRAVAPSTAHAAQHAVVSLDGVWACLQTGKPRR